MQEPGDPAAEVAPAEAPLVEVLERLGARQRAATKPSTVTSANREDEDGELDPLDGGEREDVSRHQRLPASLSRGTR